MDYAQRSEDSGGNLVILALLAVKSVLRRNEVLHPDKSRDA